MTTKEFSIDNLVKAVNKNTDTDKNTTDKKPKAQKSTTNETDSSVNDLLQNKKRKKKPRYLYFEADTDRALGKLGDRLGKSKGGASAITEIALEEFFSNHDFSEIIGDYRPNKH